MNTETKRKLVALNLEDIAASIEFQEMNPSKYMPMSFTERIDSIVDDIYQKRTNEKIKRRIKQAHLRYPNASVTDIDYDSRKLDSSFIREIVTLKFVYSSTNIMIVGPTGSGKTYLADAIVKEVCKKDLRAYTIRMPELLEARAEAKELKRENRYLNKLAAYDVLAIDEWLIFDLSIEDIHFLYELFELRYGNSPTIFVGQYPVEEWHKRLGGGTHADSIMDRLIHNSVQIQSGNANMREILDTQKIPFNK